MVLARVRSGVVCVHMWCMCVHVRGVCVCVVCAWCVHVRVLAGVGAVCRVTGGMGKLDAAAPGSSWGLHSDIDQGPWPAATPPRASSAAPSQAGAWALQDSCPHHAEGRGLLGGTQSLKPEDQGPKSGACPPTLQPTPSSWLLGPRMSSPREGGGSRCPLSLPGSSLRDAEQDLSRGSSPGGSESESREPRPWAPGGCPRLWAASLPVSRACLPCRTRDPAVVPWSGICTSNFTRSSASLTPLWVLSAICSAVLKLSPLCVPRALLEISRCQSGDEGGRVGPQAPLSLGTSQVFMKSWRDQDRRGGGARGMCLADPSSVPS